MANSVVQTIIDAEVDARSLSEFISKGASFTVARRLAPSIHTLDYYLDKLEQLEPTVIQRVEDAIYDTVLSSGFVTVDSFELGATITQRNQALRHTADGKLYRWAGDLPKDVPASSTPSSSGGVGDNAWLEVNDATLRSEIGDLGFANVIVSNKSPSPDDGVLNDLWLRTQAKTPSDVDDLLYHFDASSLPLSDGDRVSLWDAEGDSGMVIEQLNPDKQPKYISEAIGYKPAVYFEKSRGDFLKGELPVTNKGSTIFMVCLIQGENGSVLFDGYSGGNRTTVDYGSESSRNRVNTFGAAGPRYDLPTPPLVICSPSSSEFRVNGIGTGTDTPGGNFGGLTLGTRYLNEQHRAFTGYIAEFIVYNRSLTIGEIKDVEKYLSDKYRIAEGPYPEPYPEPEPELPKFYHFDAGGLTLNDQDPVSSWASSDGSLPLTISNSDPSSQPTYISSGDAGLPCVRFDKSLNTRLFSSHSPINGEVTLFMVARIEEGADTIFDSVTSSNRFCLYWQSGQFFYLKQSLESFNSFRQSLPIPTTVMVGRIGVGGSHRVDGFSGGGGTSFTQSIESLQVGCRYSLNRGASMDVYEIILYSGVLTDEQTKKIEGELANKYRIKLAR